MPLQATLTRVCCCLSTSWCAGQAKWFATVSICSLSALLAKIVLLQALICVVGAVLFRTFKTRWMPSTCSVHGRCQSGGSSWQMMRPCANTMQLPRSKAQCSASFGAACICQSRACSAKRRKISNWAVANRCFWLCPFDNSCSCRLNKCNMMSSCQKW